MAPEFDEMHDNAIEGNQGTPLVATLTRGHDNDDDASASRTQSGENGDDIVVVAGGYPVAMVAGHVRNHDGVCPVGKEAAGFVSDDDGFAEALRI